MLVRPLINSKAPSSRSEFILTRVRLSDLVTWTSSKIGLGFAGC